MKTAVYNKLGKEVSQVELPALVFDLPWNADLVHQVFTSMQTNARTPIAHTKTRSEVSGTGKKPWQQKGTGRARHGSRRSPIWVGGGIAHGPRNDRNFDRKVNKKMRIKALYTILSQKFRDGEILLVDDLSFSEPKTKEAKSVISSLASVKGFETLSTKRKNAAFIGIDDKDVNTSKSFSNIGSVKVDEIRNLNPITALTYKYLIIENPKKSIEDLVGKLSVKK